MADAKRKLVSDPILCSPSRFAKADLRRIRFGLPLSEVSTRVRELGALCVSALGKLDQLCVVIGGFRAFACDLRRTRGRRKVPLVWMNT